MPAVTFEDWEPAAAASKQRRAISEVYEDLIFNGRETKPYKYEIIKPLHGDPYAVYAGGGIRVHSKKITAREVDRCRKWRPY